MITASVNTAVVGGKVTLDITLADSTSGFMTATVQWGDGHVASGTDPNYSDKLTGRTTLSTTLVHAYVDDGFYSIQVGVVNRNAPVSDSITVSAPVTITTKPFVPSANYPGFILGPILPLDKSFPTVANWCFSTGKDIQVLESNLRLLLLTSYGERLWYCGYGTGIRSMVFEKDLRLVQTVVQEEITAAVSTYEPRLTLANMAVNQLSDKEVQINAVFTPKDDIGNSVQLSVTLNQ
jgi:phage baseplate assembly protein W